MMKGCDSADVPALAMHAEQLKEEGFSFVAGYLRRSAQARSQFAPGLVAKFGEAGLALVSVFEHRSDTPAYFTFANGEIDGRAAVARAKEIGQPVSSAIYGAYDTDYFKAWRTAALAYGEGFARVVAGEGYAVGGYGDDELLTLLSEHFIPGFGDLINHNWLANAVGWLKDKGFQNWDIRQSSMPKLPWLGAPFQIDEDVTPEGVDDEAAFVRAGMWRPV